jgi:uroporphyrinogen decarboxylase
MEPMTTHERMQRVYEHREPDRVPITDYVWKSTLARWRAEGMPDGVEWERYFELDRVITLDNRFLDTSPQFPCQVIEETEDYRIETDTYGVTKKNFKPVSSTPQYLDFTVKNPDAWREAKQRMTPSRDRIDWEILRRNYRSWRNEGAWINVTPWFGYDIVNSRMCGTETVLVAMALDPEWIIDMFNHGCELGLKLLDMIWEEGYPFDELIWCDDMAYKGGMIFSKKMWHEMVKPYQQRTIDWAHAHGIKAHLHCCGNISVLIPELIEIGLDGLDPMEVKAGMDPVAIKRAYGKDLVLKGGSNAANWGDYEAVEAEIKSMLSVMMESGGYVFSSDHSVPDYTSLNTYRRIVEFVKAKGIYY